MPRQKNASKASIEIVKEVIRAQQKLFDDGNFTDSPETQAIVHQMIHGRPQHKSIRLYQYLAEAFLLAGGGDQSNLAYYSKQQRKPTFNRIRQALTTAQCPKLSGFDAFKGCGYRKTGHQCNEPAFLGTCPVPAFDMKRGPLNQMAFSLYFFLRDVAQRDFYAYVTEHFRQGELAAGAVNDRLQSFVGKVTAIANVGPKLAHMALSGLFLTRYPDWDYREVGLRMVAIDSLVHNFLHRTGILANYQSEHVYGPRCYSQTGCFGVIQDLAHHIDCREFDPSLPAHFPRFIQHHIWAYGAKDGENICNLNKCKPGQPNPACILHQQRLCTELPPQNRPRQPGDEYLFP
jgi:hypothetical protein